MRFRHCSRNLGKLLFAPTEIIDSEIRPSWRHNNDFTCINFLHTKTTTLRLVPKHTISITIVYGGTEVIETFARLLLSAQKHNEKSNANSFQNCKTIQFRLGDCAYRVVVVKTSQLTLRTDEYINKPAKGTKFSRSNGHN